MSIFDNVGSNYLSAKKLGTRTIVGTVDDIREELVRSPDGKEEKRHVLYIEGESKGLVLNSTNCDALAEIAGSDDPDVIINKAIKVELRVEKVPFANKKVDGIRVHKAAAPF